MKKVVVAPISNTIYYATVNEARRTMSSTDRKDITDDCIRAVFEWFMNNMDDNSEYSITFESSKYELVMREKEAEKTLDKQRKEDEKNEVQ